MQKHRRDLVLLAFTFFFFLGHLSADCLSDYCPTVCVNARVAYFRPESKKVRKIYADGWADYQLEVFQELCPNWQIWSGISGFSKKGHSLELHDHTKLQLIPLSLGLKYIYPFTCNLDGYLGVGACYSFLHIRDHSDYVEQHISRQDWGGVGQIGLYYQAQQGFFINLFADYFYQRFYFHHVDFSHYVQRHNLNLSGWKLGAGIGICF